jgi:hypothetical protein
MDEIRGLRAVVLAQAQVANLCAYDPADAVERLTIVTEARERVKGLEPWQILRKSFDRLK